MKGIYRRVVEEINNDNYMKYFDIQNFNQDLAISQFNLPVYIDNMMKKNEEAKESRINLHE